MRDKNDIVNVDQFDQLGQAAEYRDIAIQIDHPLDEAGQESEKCWLQRIRELGRSKLGGEPPCVSNVEIGQHYETPFAKIRGVFFASVDKKKKNLEIRMVSLEALGGQLRKWQEVARREKGQTADCFRKRRSSRLCGQFQASGSWITARLNPSGQARRIQHLATLLPPIRDRLARLFAGCKAARVECAACGLRGQASQPCRRGVRIGVQSIRRDVGLLGFDLPIAAPQEIA